VTSGCELDNEVSFKAHVAIGYEEVERAMLFGKAGLHPNNPQFDFSLRIRRWNFHYGGNA